MADLPPSYSHLNNDSESELEIPPPAYREILWFEEGFLEPAADSSALPPVPDLIYNPPNLVFEDIYEACVNYVREHYFYGKKFLDEMKLLDVINKAVFYYKLESFSEKRKMVTKFTPYMGQPIDGPENGQPSRPWDISVLPPDLFKDCDVTVSVPHTDVVRVCSKCDGNGEVSCENCAGNRNVPAFPGHNDADGYGRKKCSSCVGLGKITCKKCRGYKTIKTRKVLKVTWKNHIGEYFTDMGYLPHDRIRKAKGVELLKKKAMSLQPITSAPDRMLITASARLLESHANSFPDEKIIRQRHILRAFPLTRATYQWQQKDGEFYVYDIDRKVYFEDYPQKYCCCACS